MNFCRGNIKLLFYLFSFNFTLYLYLSTARTKTPPKPRPSIYEEMAAEKARASQEARRALPGDLPKFKVKLPKVIELEEGDRLRLEVRADGTPNPLGKILNIIKEKL
jgi:hypothetical protein